MTTGASLEDRLRELAPLVLGALVRRHPRDFDGCEDAVQEALLAASRQWPADGVPDDPRAWLLTVAGRRLTDLWRADSARRVREEGAAADPLAGRAAPGAEEDVLAAADAAELKAFPAAPPGAPPRATAPTPPRRAGAAAAPPPSDLAPDGDDTLALLFLCCHPALSPASQIALTLRAVGGLTTAEIASAFLVPEATMAQRISRAKARIRATGTRFAMPPGEERAARLGAVLHVLYLVFNEGYAASSGARLARAELTSEAIRLTRALRERLPHDGEVEGLLALMLLTDARRPARTGPDGSLIPLAEQDRSRWSGAEIDEGVALVSDALARAPLGPYQLQAAIAAVHAEAAEADDTDWPQIVALYRVLACVAPNPMVSLNHAVAVAMVDGPRAGLALLEALDEELAASHRLVAVRAHLLDLAGDAGAAAEAYREAARRTTSLPERRYLETRAAALRAV